MNHALSADPAEMKTGTNLCAMPSAARAPPREERRVQEGTAGLGRGRHERQRVAIPRCGHPRFFQAVSRDSRVRTGSAAML